MAKRKRKIEVNSESEETELEEAAEETEADELPSEVAQGEAEEENPLEAEARESMDRYLRAVAELENAKKRFAKERSDLIKYAGESLVVELLEVVDNLERALKSATQNEDSELVKGVELILGQFVNTLSGYGVRAESSIGRQFDPNKHQAMTTVPSDEHPPGSVIEEFKKAYFFKDKLIRPAQVVVSKAVENKAE